MIKHLTVSPSIRQEISVNKIIFAKLSLNSTKLNFNFNFEAEMALFSDNTATHPPTHPPTHRESSKMEQDIKYFNWKV